MTLQSAAEDDEYRPEYGLVVIRDIYAPGRYDGRDDPVDGLDGLEELDVSDYSRGTVALAASSRDK